MKLGIKKNQSIVIASIVVIAIVMWIYRTELFYIDWFTKYSSADSDDQSFSFDPDDLTILGCTNENAQNYNPLANTDQDGGVHECFYNWGCCSSSADNYDPAHDSCYQENNNDYLCNWGDGVGEGGNPDGDPAGDNVASGGCVNGLKQVCFDTIWGNNPCFEVPC